MLHVIDPSAIYVIGLSRGEVVITGALDDPGVRSEDSALRSLRGVDKANRTRCHNAISILRREHLLIDRWHLGQGQVAHGPEPYPCHYQKSLKQGISRAFLALLPSCPKPRQLSFSPIDSSSYSSSLHARKIHDPARVPISLAATPVSMPAVVIPTTLLL